MLIGNRSPTPAPQPVVQPTIQPQGSLGLPPVGSPEWDLPPVPREITVETPRTELSLGDRLSSFWEERTPWKEESGETFGSWVTDRPKTEYETQAEDYNRRVAELETQRGTLEPEAFNERVSEFERERQELGAKAPSGLETARDIGIGLVPIVGTAALWSRMSPGEKALSVGTDVLTFIPGLGWVAKGAASGARVSKGATTAARAGVALKNVAYIGKESLLSIPKTVIAVAKAPVTLIKEPAKIGSAIKEFGGLVTYPIRKPGETLRSLKEVGLGEVKLYQAPTLLEFGKVGYQGLESGKVKVPYYPELDTRVPTKQAREAITILLVNEPTIPIYGEGQGRPFGYSIGEIKYGRTYIPAIPTPEGPVRPGLIPQKGERLEPLWNPYRESGRTVVLPTEYDIPTRFGSGVRVTPQTYIEAVSYPRASFLSVPAISSPEISPFPVTIPTTVPIVTPITEPVVQPMIQPMVTPKIQPLTATRILVEPKTSVYPEIRTITETKPILQLPVPTITLTPDVVAPRLNYPPLPPMFPPFSGGKLGDGGGFYQAPRGKRTKTYQAKTHGLYSVMPTVSYDWSEVQQILTGKRGKKFRPIIKKTTKQLAKPGKALAGQRAVRI